MPKFSLTRRQLLVVAAPIVASIPLVKLGLGSASAQELTPLDEDLDLSRSHARGDDRR